MSLRQRTQTYYGYAFESYCTSDTPTRTQDAAPKDVPQGWSGDVNTNVQWCSVVRTKLGDTRLILGGEVDCVRGAYARAPARFGFSARYSYARLRWDRGLAYLPG